MSLKEVRKILYAEEVDMGGFMVRQPFPTVNVDYLDPFLLLHHHKSVASADTNPRDAGVGPHPHRGFTPVTFIYDGDVHHRDSRGNSDVIEAGGVQWMDAGMGIIHSERPSKSFAEKGGPFEIIQLWINIPKAGKMSQPEYQAFQGDSVPQLQPDGGEGKIYVYAGSISGKKGPITSKVKVTAARIDLSGKGSVSLQMDENESTFLYVLSGSVRIEGHGLVEHHNLILFGEEGNQISLEGLEESRMLLMSGKHLNEPVTKYGPFVMSDQTEIMEAMRDYQMGKMGILIEEF